MSDPYVIIGAIIDWYKIWTEILLNPGIHVFIVYYAFLARSESCFETNFSFPFDM